MREEESGMIVEHLIDDMLVNTARNVIIIVCLELYEHSDRDM